LALGTKGGSSKSGEKKGGQESEWGNNPKRFLLEASGCQEAGVTSNGVAYKQKRKKMTPGGGGCCAAKRARTLWNVDTGKICEGQKTDAVPDSQKR